MKLQSFGKDLWKLGLILLIPVLFGVALLAWLVSLDVRETGHAKPVGVAGVPLLGRAADLTSGTAHTSAAAPGTQTTRDLCLAAFARLAADVTSETRRTEAATAKLEALFVTPDARAQARQVGREFTDLYKSLAEYYRDRQWVNAAAAEARLKRLLADFHRVNGEFERMLMDPAAMRKGLTEDPETVADREMQTCRIKTSIEDSLLALLIYHEQWTKAADLAHGLKRQDGWVFEKELLARLGPAGERLIATRAAARNLKALKRSVMSIGPDFQGPHHEPGD